ncbi:signal peptidase II [Sanguibacter sp. A247]|uniref:signal peptidase II n=1 Tax=Sanguibacter sp. A247 TaxID=3457327 RepID=UPI003FD763DA
MRATTAPTRQRRLLWPILLGALVLAGIDQATKELALARLEPGAETHWFLGELLGWKLVFNPGAALSIGEGFTWILTLLVVGVSIVIVLSSRRITSRPWAFALALILGGAVGNLVDRLARDPGFGHGHVVDFINYAGFFVGNVADIAIVGAAILVVWLSFRGVPFGDESGRAPASPTDDSAPADADATDDGSAEDVDAPTHEGTPS